MLSTLVKLIFENIHVPVSFCSCSWIWFDSMWRSYTIQQYLPPLIAIYQRELLLAINIFSHHSHSVFPSGLSMINHHSHQCEALLSISTNHQACRLSIWIIQISVITRITYLLLTTIDHYQPWWAININQHVFTADYPPSAAKHRRTQQCNGWALHAGPMSFLDRCADRGWPSVGKHKLTHLTLWLYFDDCL